MLKSNNAEMLVKAWTGNRSATATGFKKERVDALIESLQVELDAYTEKTQDGLVKRVSNDGYAEDYVIETEAELMERLKGIAAAYLSGTGLMGAYYV